MLNRRDLMKALGATAASSCLPRMALATADSDARFVLVVLRGAVDGLALAAPYGDGNYQRARGELAIAAPGHSGGLLKLDGLFGLNPALLEVHRRYTDGQALIVHAVASPYRQRSHFDGQDILENGAARVGALRDGWLNRALGALDSSSEVAIALAQNTPLVLRGNQDVSSWAPTRLPDVDDSTIARLQRLYAADGFFASRLEQALRSQDIADDFSAMAAAKPRGNEAQQFSELMQAASRFLSADDGPRIAVVELGGWDTHANQGTSSGALANRFTALDNGLQQLHDGLGSHWDKTVVAVVTEFGRTVHVNGTRGTDHGTGTAAVLLGGAVNGGRVVADWPGLSKNELHEQRDLKPTTDIRSLFKAVLQDHLDVPSRHIEQNVFPDSAAATALSGLIVT
ncbi:MAG: DUF1501 domain-containing protein [Woeseiaceae bacterium]